MNTFTNYAMATAAIVSSLTANAAASPHPGRLQPATAERATSGPLTWAVVRVSVSARGDVEGMRITYASAGEPFTASVLQAVSKTNFEPLAETAKASTFDYFLSTDAHGKRATRIMVPLPGDPQVSSGPSVAVRAANPWTLGDTLACVK